MPAPAGLVPGCTLVVVLYVVDAISAALAVDGDRDCHGYLCSVYIQIVCCLCDAIIVQSVCNVKTFEGGFFVLPQRLRELRLKHRFTQQNMADQLSMSLNAYQKYEQGERSPSLDTLVKLADLYEVPTDYLLGRDDFLKTLGVSIEEFH